MLWGRSILACRSGLGSPGGHNEATPMTARRRYCYLPFLYDDEAARVREANAGLVGAGV